MAEKPLKEQTESLEEQARLYRDIVEEKKIISELTVEELSFQRDLVEEQQNNLKELRNDPKFIKISNSGMMESGAHTLAKIL